MGKLDRVMRRCGLAPSLLLCVLFAACSPASGELTPGAGSARPDRKRAKAAIELVPDARLDAEGKLKPGSLHASWLEIPSGFVEQPGSTQHLSAFTAVDMPYAKVREFLTARLLPEKTEYPVHGMSFREALPTHTQLTMARLNVLLVETDRAKSELRLVVEDLSPPPGKPLSPDNAAQALTQDRRHTE